MKTKILWLFLSCILVLSLVLASCGTKTTPTTTTITTTAPTTKPTTSTTAPTTSATITSTQAVTTPQYGGTITFRVNADARTFDPYFYPRTQGDSTIKLWLETLAMVDFNAVYQEKYHFQGGFVPLQYMTGYLTESWETDGMANLTFNVRKGVTWQDKEPMNGREFTASDIEYSFHRLLGKGSGFDSPSPYVSMGNYQNIDTVTATDKSTVVFKLNTPSLEQFRYLVNEINYAAIVPMEAVKQYGDLQDWKNAVGTGPFVLTDYVSGSSITAVKSSNYWCYDEVYPQNKLPYVDKVRVLIIPDNATALAALRSGKIDIINLIPWEQAEGLQKTNPELLYRTQLQNGYGIFLHADTKPFDDIRVRQAMQKAVDYKSIAANYYGGNAMSDYAGVWVQEGYSRPFSEWPAEVQAGYTFDVAAAKKLLSDAGYPSGFQFTMLLSSSSDSDLYQIVKSYFFDVGIDMDIQILDAPSFEAITRADKHVAQGHALVWWNAPPQQLVNQRKSTHYPYRHHINSPEYDAMWAQVNAAISDQDQVDTILKMFDLATREQWTVNLPPFYYYILWQPWLKRYNGINTQMHPAMGELFARLWIDENLK